MNIKRTLAFFVVSVLFSSQALAAEDDRANVMECSHSEVMAYMELPNPERRAMSDYYAWKEAYKSTEVQRAETDPRVCVGLLYGDLEEIGNRVRAAAAILSSGSLPSMSELANQAMDKLSESICKRALSTANGVQAEIVSEIEANKQIAYDKMIDRYGVDAMEDQVNESVLPPVFTSNGVQYRNGEINDSRLRSKVRSRWSNELSEMKNNAVDSASGN